MSNLSQKLDQTSSLIDSSVNIEEPADCKKRLNNLILFNLQESIVDLLELDFPEDQMKEDCLNFKELISNKIMLEPDAVLDIYCLGRKNDDTLRPLSVKLRSEKLKWDIIKSSKNFKYLKNGMSDPIYVTWDKTVKERQELKKLIAKLKSRKNNGEQNLVICGNKIIAKSLQSDRSYHPFPSKALDFWASLFQ